MVARAMQRLRGRRLRTTERLLGVLNDVYFDSARWRVRYLALESTEGLRSAVRLIIPAACVHIQGIGEEELLVQLEGEALEQRHRLQRHLISAREAASYRTQTVDGATARIDDVLVGVDWSVAGFVVAAPGWVLPGSQLEVAPGAVQGIDRERLMVRVKLTARELQRLPRAEWRSRR